MKYILLLIAKWYHKRVRSLYLSDDLLTRTADHHIFAKIFDIKILLNICIAGLKFNKIAVIVHFL